MSSSYPDCSCQHKNIETTFEGASSKCDISNSLLKRFKDKIKVAHVLLKCKLIILPIIHSTYEVKLFKKIKINRINNE